MDDEHVSTDPADHKRKRGELRIYLGAAPGVGKTFAMLGEAHRRLERGTDIVAAVVETHGRKKTADLLAGIEIIPPKYIEYRGSRFGELDVEAVLQRRPQVVLVDELAHTNTPGSKNAKPARFSLFRLTRSVATACHRMPQYARLRYPQRYPHGDRLGFRGSEVPAWRNDGPEALTLVSC